MKLELKHVSSYLPYGLKFRVNLSDVQENYKNELREFTLTTTNLDLLLGYGGKPILRPLSSLYKPLKDGTYPIAVIGQMYEPNGKLYSEDDTYSYGWNTHVCDDYQGYEIGWIDSVGWFGIFYDEYDMKNQDNNFTGDYMPFNREIFEYLFQHHFDVYGLIEKGLAVDINTIENV